MVSEMVNVAVIVDVRMCRNEEQNGIADRCLNFSITKLTKTHSGSLIGTKGEALTV